MSKIPPMPMGWSRSADDQGECASSSSVGASLEASTATRRPLPRLVWLFWAQGFDESTPALVQDVARSWAFHNPTWRIMRLDQWNVTRFVNVSRLRFNGHWAASSDLLRLSLLADYGGVWADATLLCFQPLDAWADAAVAPTGLFMYRGRKGPCSYFMVSEPHAYTVCAWRRLADEYWRGRSQPGPTILMNKTVRLRPYFWLNGLFATELAREPEGPFARAWAKVPYLWGPATGSIDGQPLTTLDHPIGKRVMHVYLAGGVPRALKLSVKRRCYHCFSNQSTVAEWLVGLSLNGTARPAERPGSLDGRHRRGVGCSEARDRLLCT